MNTVTPTRPRPAPDLTTQVACSPEPVNQDLLERVRHETLTIPTGWVTGYSEYQSGGWGTLSLMNQTGDPTDVTIADAEPIPTTLLTRMPATRRLLDQLGLDYMWVRLAQMSTNAYLWEHRDYQEDELAQVERQRVHIPIVTNSSARLVLAGAAVHLAPGRIWRLNPTYAHAACNIFGPPRIHLIADVYANDQLGQLRHGERLPGESTRALPEASRDQLVGHTETADQLAGLGCFTAAETHLKRLFFRYRLPEGTPYNMIIDMYRRRGDAAAIERWTQYRQTVLGEEVGR